ERERARGPPAGGPPPQRGRGPGRGALRPTALRVLIAVVVLGAGCRRSDDPDRKTQDAVRVAGPAPLAVASDSGFGTKLETVVLETETVSIPTFSVTGSVAAQLRPGAEERVDRWQFATAELQSAWADWNRTRGEIAFNERQLQASRE